MVILIAIRSGYEELKPLIISGEYPVWIGADVLSQLEVDSLRGLGVELSVFSYSIDPANIEDVEGALITISEHHPGQKVWVEWMERL